MKMVILAVFCFAGTAWADCSGISKDVVGKWLSQRTGESLEINENGSFMHSKAGAGDLRHIAGDRYEITYYSKHTGKPLRSCMVVFTRRDNGTVNTLSPDNNPNCSFGVMDPVTNTKKPANAPDTAT